MKDVIDALDWDLLKHLKTDSRRSNVALAKELEVSEGMIRQRINRLKNNGTITRFTIETAPKGLRALIEVEVDVNVLTTSLSNKIRNLEGIEKVYEISGAADIIALVDVEDTKRLNEVIETIRRMEHIRSTRTKLVLGEL